MHVVELLGGDLDAVVRLRLVVADGPIVLAADDGGGLKVALLLHGV